MKLVDYRGKYVLLDFWSTTCPPCLALTPKLKACYEAFANDDRFVMIGLSVDQDMKAPKAYAAKESLPWIQGFLGRSDNGKAITNSYGILGIPSLMLIGPDGRVVAKNLRGSGIKAAVAKALGEAKRP